MDKVCVVCNGLINDSKEFNVHERKSVTKREKECINGLVEGMSAKEIAKILNISHRTVEKYIENLKFKFDCKNLKQLIAVSIYNLKLCQIDNGRIE